MARAELYPDLASKAASLSHSLIQNHALGDGNKYIGHAAMEVFRLLNSTKLTHQSMSRSRS